MDRWTVPRHLKSIDQAFEATPGVVPEQVALPTGELVSGKITQFDSLFRVRALFIAPADGEYRFSIAGDDLTRLSFSSDETPLKKRLIGKADGYTGPGSWKTFPTQTSEAIPLTRGQRYYLEAMCFNQGGEGHFQVGWQPPGAKEIQPLPLKSADGSALLESYKVPDNDTDDDELPDEWEKEKGLEIGKNRLHGADGDPDGDGAANRQEFVAGTDPLKGDAIAGSLRHEIWPNRGDTVWEQLFSYGFHRLHLPASLVQLEKSVTVKPFSTPGFQRTRGFLLPPQSGSYRFHLAGQGLVSLDLSPGGDNLKKRRILQAGTILKELQPDNLPPGLFPESAPVLLKQGERCFFEALLYQYKWAYFLKLEWTRPDGVREKIPLSAMQSYVSPFTDADQDDLPDEWEKENGLEINGNNPKHFATGDPDFDGADNAAEFFAKTNPLKADSDSDDATDGEEIALLGTNPREHDAPLGAPLDIDLFSAEALSPGWSRADPDYYEDQSRMPPPMPNSHRSSLSLFRGCGTVQWKFKVEEPGLHLIRFPLQPVTLFPTHEIGLRSEIWVDDKKLPEVSTFGTAMALHQVSQMSPWLGKGEHTLRLRLNPAFMPSMTRVFGVSVVPVKEGKATNAVKQKLAASNRFSGGTGKSLTSPVTVSFVSRVEDSSQLNAAGKAIAMKRVNGSEAWADVDLPADGKALALQASSEGGVVKVENTCEWAATNVLEIHKLTLRAGDSLRLTATTAVKGEANLEADGERKKLAAGEVWVRKFAKEGRHRVKGRFQPVSGDATEGELEVTVLSPLTGLKPVLARVGSATVVPTLPMGVAIDGGEIASVEAAANGELMLSPKVPGDFQLPIRIAESGAVLGMIELKAFRIHEANEPYWTGRDDEPSPGRLVHVVMENLPENAIVEMTCLDPDLYIPYADRGNKIRLAVRDAAQAGLATLHVRAVKDANQWLRTELIVLMPDGREL